MFLGFANFYRRFTRNLNKIAASLTSILQITNDDTLITQATENNKNQDVPASVSGGRVGGSFENLSIT